MAEAGTDMAALHKRIGELEAARDSQVETIRKLRAQGQVRYALTDEYAVFGTSRAINILRERLA